MCDQAAFDRLLLGGEAAPAVPAEEGARAEGTQYARADNFAEVLIYLNDSLDTRGYPSGLFMGSETTPMSDAHKAEVVNVIYEVFTDVVRQNDDKTKLADEVDEHKRDNVALKVRLDKLKDSLTEAQRKSWEAEMKWRALETEGVGLAKRWKQDLAKAHKENTILQRRDNQLKNEIRKREMATKKVQDRLEKVTRDRMKADKSGLKMTLSNVVVGGSTRREWKVEQGKEHGDLLRSSLKASHERIEQVLGENEELRGSFAGLYRQVQVLLEEKKAIYEGLSPQHKALFTPATKAALREFQPGHFELPLGMLKSQYETTLRAKVDDLKAQLLAMEKMEEEVIEAERVEDTVARLKLHLETQKQVLAEQDKLLQSRLFSDQVMPTPAATQENRWSLLEQADQSKRFTEMAGLLAGGLPALLTPAKTPGLSKHLFSPMTPLVPPSPMPHSIRALMDMATPDAARISARTTPGSKSKWVLRGMYFPKMEGHLNEETEDEEAHAAIEVPADTSSADASALDGAYDSAVRDDKDGASDTGEEVHSDQAGGQGDVSKSELPTEKNLVLGDFEVLYTAEDKENQKYHCNKSNREPQASW